MSNINLNDPKYISKKFVTKTDLYKHYSEYDILRAYFGDIKINTVISSPLRKDNHPSFNIFYSPVNGCLLFKDFTTDDKGDIIRLVQLKYSLPIYQDALNKIAFDFGLNKEFELPKTMKKEDIDIVKYDIGLSSYCEKYQYNIQISIRNWELRDYDFWRSFGISSFTLKKYNVIPISGYFVNAFEVKTPDIAYAYIELKDNKVTYKIYRPTKDKALKWRTNNSDDVHPGYMQLPKNSNLLIITKSLKDVMAIDENCDIACIAIQAETNYIKEHVMLEYKQRFKYVISLFDNDDTGKTQAERYKDIYNIPSIFIPEKYECKDFSDLIKKEKRDVAQIVMKQLILNYK